MLDLPQEETMTTTIRFTLAAMALALTAGCESIESTDVMTSAMYADFSATSDGATTHALAILRAGGATSNTFVNLEGDDILTVSAAGESQEMTEGYIGDIYAYDADFDLFQADTEFTFSLDRSIDAGAPDSRCSLPEPLELTAPTDGDTYSRGQNDLGVTWSPASEADEIRIVVQGDCLWQHIVDVDGDPGSYVIPAGTLDSIDQDNPQACDATVTVQRRRFGSLDAGFGEGGTIYGIQARVADIRSDP